MPEARQIAGVILVDDHKRYLMVQERQEKVFGLWNIPAGYIDEKETPQQAAVREAREEVGLEVEIIDAEPIYTESNSEKNRTYSAYMADIVGGKLFIQEAELIDAKWLSFEDIKALSDNNKIRDRWIMNALYKAEKHENNRH